MNIEQAINWYSEEIEKYRHAQADAILNGAQQIVEQAEIVIQMLCAGLSALREKAERENPKPLTLEQLKERVGKAD